ncbi:tetratricopeptide repeat protein [Bacillus sp. WMMC1349]|uniref:response regulator aspartate phosphatase n=1 Tax=Bacillus sp. WMMC1349 TaxID=2736254 RepID=UPI0020A6BD80|nr:tetratricopeptide repeat protein [Bacillus sp. WMMC1349]
MSKEETIPYDLVATKMNFWYNSLKNNWIHKAEETKEEVRELLENMEENQDVLVYYSLLEFRHKLQLDYLYADSGSDLEERFKEFKRIRERNKLEGMLEYYYQFFSGMYHFRQKELLHALRYYRNAEIKLEVFNCDELEKAEFYFKISELYYNMKQTLFSMDYANQAYNIFKQYDTYGDKCIRTNFIIAGNYSDQLHHEMALNNLQKALAESEKMEEGFLIGASHLNIGLCYNELEELERSSNHLQKSLEIYREDSSIYSSKAAFNLAYVEARKGNIMTANDLYFEGKELAEKHQTLDDLAKLQLLKGLHLDYDMDLMRESFKFFKEKGMYAEMEDYGLDAAKVLEKTEKLHDAIECYRTAFEARCLIKRSVLAG